MKGLFTRSDQYDGQLSPEQSSHPIFKSQYFLHMQNISSFAPRLYNLIFECVFETSQAREGLSDEKLAEYKDIFSFFDRWCREKLIFLILTKLLIPGTVGGRSPQWSLARCSTQLHYISLLLGWMDHRVG